MGRLDRNAKSPNMGIQEAALARAGLGRGLGTYGVGTRYRYTVPYVRTSMHDLYERARRGARGGARDMAYAYACMQRIKYNIYI